MKNNFTSFGLVILRKQREDCLSSINHMCYYYSSCSNQGRNNLGTPSRRGKECSLCCTGQWPNQAGSVSQPYQVSHPFSGEAQARRDPFATSSTYTNSKVLLNDLIMCSQHKERALWEQHLPWMVLVLEVNIWDRLLFLLPRGKKKNLSSPALFSHVFQFPATSQVHRYGLQNQIIVLLLMNCLPALSSIWAERQTGSWDQTTQGSWRRG